MTRRHLLPVLLQPAVLQDPKDITLVQPDLKVPPPLEASPTPGRRVRVGTADLYHLLYLPEDWKPGLRYPLIVEFPGNGPGLSRPPLHRDSVGSGTPADTALGYGLSAGRGFLWLSLPFIGADGAVATTWWGEPLATVDYCRRTVVSICQDFGGDPDRILLCGFSRGSIACNFMGLYDESIAGLWRAFYCHSHYDGVRRWPYPGSDRESALVRLKRLNRRPQFITHESSVEDARRYLEATQVAGDFTFAALPYANHTGEWLLRPIPLRNTVRTWLGRVMV